MPAIPKPQPRVKPPRQPLKSKSRLQSKSQLKIKSRIKTRYNPTPNKHLLIERDGPFCIHLGCCENGTDDHHIVFRSHSDPKWQDDLRNRFLLCRKHHILAHEKVGYRLYYEALGVHKFGWWAGESITVSEWVSRNEFRLFRANINVTELIKNVKENVR